MAKALSGTVFVSNWGCSSGHATDHFTLGMRDLSWERYQTSVAISVASNQPIPRIPTQGEGENAGREARAAAAPPFTTAGGLLGFIKCASNIKPGRTIAMTTFPAMSCQASIWCRPRFDAAHTKKLVRVRLARMTNTKDAPMSTNLLIAGKR